MHLNFKVLNIFLFLHVCTCVKLVDEPRLRCWSVNGMRDERVKVEVETFFAIEPGPIMRVLSHAQLLSLSTKTNKYQTAALSQASR